MSKKPSCRFRKYINYSKLEQIESKQAETALKFSVCKLANKMLEAENAALKSRVALLERIIDRVTVWAKRQQYDRVKKLFEILAKKPT